MQLGAVRGGFLKFGGWIGILAALCIGSGAAAQERTKAPGAPCKAAGSPNLTAQCFLAHARQSDRQLEWMLRVLARQLKPQEFEKLQNAEVRWWSFRASNCDAEEALYTQAGTASVVYAACLEADTRQRVEELKTMYAWLFQTPSVGEN
jgi:uncharacterized protein YecT (DUF1311 family)